MYNNTNLAAQPQPTYAAYQTPQQAYSVNRPLYQQVMQSPYMGIKGRPVASIEEARASIIDFDGSIFYFPDLANKRIYTKQINVDGTAILNMYELKEIPVADTSGVGAQYVTREEFETAINQLRQIEMAAPVPQSVPAEPAPKPASAGIALNF